MSAASNKPESSSPPVGAAPSPAPDAPYDDLVTRLLAAYDTGPRSMHHLGAYELPQMGEVVRCLEEMRALIFPGFVGSPLVGALAAEVRQVVHERILDLSWRLRRQIYRGLH